MYLHKIKRPKGNIAYLRNIFLAINKLEQGYGYNAGWFKNTYSQYLYSILKFLNDRQQAIKKAQVN